MTETGVTLQVGRGFPWAAVLGWSGLVLAVVAAAGAVLAADAAIDNARDPQTWGDLAAVVILMVAAVPAVLALFVGIVQAGRGWGPRWRTRSTVALASLVPLCFAAVLIVPVLLDR